MKPRPYQQAALEAIYEAWREHSSTLLVQPTGTGKTIVFAHVIKGRPMGRALVLAHRKELIEQAQDKIYRVTGIVADVEMADYRADVGFQHSPVVVSSIQTQIAGRGDGRMARFKPEQFATLIVDEAHHATARSYRRVLDYYRQNPQIKVLGVTATPDRADEAALGRVFQSVAYDYEILDAINDGWLVPIRQRVLHVQGLDLSNVRTTAGDLNGAELARVMEYERNLLEIGSATVELIGKRKSLVFAASVAHAERLSEIVNRYLPNSARWVCGETPRDRRTVIFRDYAAGEFQVLVNVGVATEGFDEPGIECVVMARPTKSRCLYAQMAGRGTRPLPGLVDPIEDATSRRAAIEQSAKPFLEILDFVGNSGKHRLISSADILGGRYEDAVVELARHKADGATGSLDMRETLEVSLREIEEQRQAARRAALRPRAEFSCEWIDPFAVFGITARRERAWNKGRPATDKQIAFLAKSGIPSHVLKNLGLSAASQLIEEIIERRNDNRCTYKQARLLARYGYDGAGISFGRAREIIDGIAANGWRQPRKAVESAVSVY